MKLNSETRIRKMALITFAVIKGPVKIIIAHIQLKNRTKLQSAKINFNMSAPDILK